VTVHRGDEFLGSPDIEVFVPLLEPPASTAGIGGETDRRTLAPLLDVLDETTFRSFDRRQLLAVSRELEDRAHRVGDGSLHAGFQRADALAKQRDVYTPLADAGLDTHVYIDDGWGADPIDGATVHTEADSELGRFWFVVFTNGTDQDCALVTREHRDGHGSVRTYDIERVADVATTSVTRTGSRPRREPLRHRRRL
jgi:DICT domain-containing protein